MLKKPNNYDEVEYQEYGDYTPLELGGHKLVIKNAEIYDGPSGHCLKITIDTDKTDIQPNYFQDQFDSNTKADKKWSNGAIKYVSLKEDETCVRMLKGFINAIENSNEKFIYDWSKEESQLIGKKIAGQFGLEEYTKTDGTIGIATKLNNFRSMENLDKITIPKVKLIDKSLIEYELYKQYKEKESTKNEISDEKEKFINDNLLD